MIVYQLKIEREILYNYHYFLIIKRLFYSKIEIQFNKKIKLIYIIINIEIFCFEEIKTIEIKSEKLYFNLNFFKVTKYRGGEEKLFFKSVQNYNINSYIYIYGKLNHKISRCLDWRIPK